MTGKPMNAFAVTDTSNVATASRGAEHLAWIDEYIAKVRPYIYVRLEDNVLIKRPNIAQKLNVTGVRILQSLLAGHSIRALLAAMHATAAQAQDINCFIHA